MIARDEAGLVGIIGGLGKTGRRVAERLTATGRAVRPLSRSTKIRFDWDQPEGWAPALAGCRAAYVTFLPDLALPGAPAAIRQLCSVARREGLEHLVLLSGRGEAGAEASENELVASGLDWTIVRASWFAQNFSESFMYDLVLAGEIALPVSEVKEPFVDTDDVADVVVAALNGFARSGRIYEVTGPEALSFRDVAAILAEVLGRDIRFSPVTREEFQETLKASGTPDEVRMMLDHLFAETLDGRNSSPATGIWDALGRQPAPFRSYVQRSAALGAWSEYRAP